MLNILPIAEWKTLVPFFVEAKVVLFPKEHFHIDVHSVGGLELVWKYCFLPNDVVKPVYSTTSSHSAPPHPTASIILSFSLQIVMFNHKASCGFTLMFQKAFFISKENVLSVDLFFYAFISCGFHTVLSRWLTFKKYLIGLCSPFLLVSFMYIETNRTLFYLQQSFICLRMKVALLFFSFFFGSNSPNSLHNSWWFSSCTCYDWCCILGDMFPETPVKKSSVVNLRNAIHLFTMATQVL